MSPYHVCSGCGAGFRQNEPDMATGTRDKERGQVRAEQAGARSARILQELRSRVVSRRLANTNAHSAHKRKVMPHRICQGTDDGQQQTPAFPRSIHWTACNRTNRQAYRTHVLYATGCQTAPSQPHTVDIAMRNKRLMTVRTSRHSDPLDLSKQ